MRFLSCNYNNMFHVLKFIAWRFFTFIVLIFEVFFLGGVFIGWRMKISSIGATKQFAQLDPPYWRFYFVYLKLLGEMRFFFFWLRGMEKRNYRARRRDKEELLASTSRINLNMREKWNNKVKPMRARWPYSKYDQHSGWPLYRYAI